MQQKKTFSKRPHLPHVDHKALAKESWKIFQVIAEFIEGYERLANINMPVSIFGSARIKPDSKVYLLTEEIASKLSNAGFSVVTGGGPGVMEAGNKGAFHGPSFSVGLNIVLPHEEISNRFQDISIRFRHFFTRKVMFVKYAVAYIAMPGGFGTLDEVAEILALIQTKKTKKIPVILVDRKFWQPLVDWFASTLAPSGMIETKDLELYRMSDTADEVVEHIVKYYEKFPVQEEDLENKHLGYEL